MIERDMVVGVVSICVGVVLLLNLWIRRSNPVQLNSMRFVEEHLGTVGGRIFVGLLGISLTAMGVFLLVKTPSTNSAKPEPDSSEGQTTSLSI